MIAHRKYAGNIIVIAVLLRFIVCYRARDKDDDELVCVQLPIRLIVARLNLLSFDNRNAKNSLIVALLLHIIHAYIRDIQYPSCAGD